MEINSNNYTEKEIDLEQLFNILWGNIMLIVSMLILGGLLAFGWTVFFIDKSYQSYSTIFIQPKIEDGNINLNDLNVNQRLVGTYTELAKSNAVLNQVQPYFSGDDLSINQIRNSISVSAIGDTQIIKVSATTKDANLSTRLVNRIVVVFLSEISETMTIDNLRVIDVAIDNETPVGPSVTLNTSIGLILGLMTGIGIAFLRLIFDKTIHTKKEAEQLLNIPVLGEILYSDEASY